MASTEVPEDFLPPIWVSFGFDLLPILACRTRPGSIVPPSIGNFPILSEVEELALPSGVKA